MKYKIAIHKSVEGFSVSVPGLPGCWSQGTTEPEVLAAGSVSLPNLMMREREDMRELEESRAFIQNGKRTKHSVARRRDASSSPGHRYDAQYRWTS